MQALHISCSQRYSNAKCHLFVITTLYEYESTTWYMVHLEKHKDIRLK